MVDDVRDNRTLKEKVIDRLLLLHILSKFRLGKTKLQKAVFFAEDSMYSKKIKSFSYFFFRWHYGEFSRELESDYLELQKNGFITKDFGTTIETEEILNHVSGLLTKNTSFIDRIDNISEWASKNSLDRVRLFAYEKIEREGKKVRDLPDGFPLLNKLDEKEATLKFDIDEGWVETLDTLFNPEESNSLRTAMNQKAVIPFEV